MKKKIFGGIAFAAVAFIAWVNVTVVENNKSVPEVSLAEVEAVASEWGGWNNFGSGQGFYKDEREEKVPCQSGNNTAGVTISGTVKGVNVGATIGTSSPAGTYKISSPEGDKNCTSTSC